MIESDGADWVYCLDTLNMKDGECPVLMWVIGSSETHLCSENFYEFLKEQISKYYNVNIM
ncbi:Antitoxin YobK [compost metagenome]